MKTLTKLYEEALIESTSNSILEHDRDEDLAEHNEEG